MILRKSFFVTFSFALFSLVVLRAIEVLNAALQAGDSDRILLEYFLTAALALLSLLPLTVAFRRPHFDRAPDNGTWDFDGWPADRD